MSQEEKKIKRPYLAMFLSFALPGLGQLYNGEFSKSMVIVGIFMVINFLASEPLRLIMDTGIENIDMIERNTLILFAAYSLAALFLTIVAMFDAKLTAEKINSENS